MWWSVLSGGGRESWNGAYSSGWNVVEVEEYIIRYVEEAAGGIKW